MYDRPVKWCEVNTINLFIHFKHVKEKLVFLGESVPNVKVLFRQLMIFQIIQRLNFLLFLKIPKKVLAKILEYLITQPTTDSVEIWSMIELLRLQGHHRTKNGKGGCVAHNSTHSFKI